MYIYLSGPIYPQDREATEKWRSLVRKWSFYKDGVKILDPCRGKPTYESSMFTPNEILLRDLMDIDKADLVLVFFNVKDDKISIGTIAEMMYAWLKKKPVVFVNPTKDLQYLSDHPWIKALTVRQFSNLEDALTYIDGFWSE